MAWWPSKRDSESLFIHLSCKKLLTVRSRPAAGPESAYVGLEIPTPTHCYLSATQFMQSGLNIQERLRLRIGADGNESVPSMHSDLEACDGQLCDLFREDLHGWIVRGENRPPSGKGEQSWAVKAGHPLRTRVFCFTEVKAWEILCSRILEVWENEQFQGLHSYNRCQEFI